MGVKLELYRILERRASIEVSEEEYRRIMGGDRELVIRLQEKAKYGKAVYCSGGVEDEAGTIMEW